LTACRPVQGRLAAAFGLLLHFLLAAWPARAGQDAEGLIAALGFKPGEVGFLVFDANSGALLDQLEADRAMIPASTEKVPTIVAAFNILGPLHRFRTQVLATGTLSKGLLAGDLVLQGGGDPSLSGDGLKDLAAAVRASGITRITGRLLYDPGPGPVVAAIDPRQPLTVPYNPGLAGLSVNYNRMELTWARNPSNGSLRQAAFAVSDRVRLPADAVTLSEIDLADPHHPVRPADDDRPGDRWIASASLEGKGTLVLPVRNAPFFAAMLFRRLLLQAGVQVPQPQPGAVKGEARIAAYTDSDPLGRIARDTLKYSNNMAAEMIGIAAGQKLGPDPSAKALAGWFKSMAPAVDWSTYAPSNHSGLSSLSRISARQMGAVLAIARRNAYDGLDFRDYLNHSRWEADLKKELPAVSVRAKTGNMNFVRGLTGWIEPGDGRLLGFALFINDPAARAALDAAIDPTAVFVPTREARMWLGRARKLEGALLRLWAAGPASARRFLGKAAQGGDDD